MLAILAYHSIDSDSDFFSISPSHLKEQLIYFKNKFEVLDIRELAQKIDTIDFSSRNIGVVTFDDGYADNYYSALPILEELGIPAVFFVSPGNLGMEYRGKKIMTIDELRILSRNSLVTIGSHGVNHPKYRSITSEETKRELAESKASLEDLLSLKVDFFSYSHGYGNIYSREIAKDYYILAFEGRGGVYDNIDAYSIPRIIFSKNISMRRFKFMTSVIYWKLKKIYDKYCNRDIQ